MSGDFKTKWFCQNEQTRSWRVFFVFSLIFGLAFSLGAILCFRAPDGLRSGFSALTKMKFDIVFADIRSLSELCLHTFRISLIDIVVLTLIELFSLSYISDFGCALLLMTRGFFLGIHAESAFRFIMQCGVRRFFVMCRISCAAICFFLLSLLFCLKAADAVFCAHTLAKNYPYRKATAVHIRFFSFGVAFGAILILDLLLSLLLS